MFVSIFIVALLCQTAVSFNVFSRSDDYFNFFVFNQQWPQTQCYQLANEGIFRDSEKKNKTCVPQGITQWTIHGLWPTVGKEHKPVFCNKSWPFDESVIQDLKPQMEHQWPSFKSDEDETEFWRHEWEKHGTCSTSLPYLNSEHKYFSITLSLNVKYDLFSVLKQSGIVPSDEKTYQVKDIEAAVLDSYQVHPIVSCFHVKRSTQMLSSIELCLDKQLCLIDCMSSSGDCDYSAPVQYPPIVHLDNLM